MTLPQNVMPSKQAPNDQAQRTGPHE